jgi:hypothetical protein
VGPRASLYGCENSCPNRNSIHGKSSPQRVAIPTKLARLPTFTLSKAKIIVPLPAHMYVNIYIYIYNRKNVTINSLLPYSVFAEFSF